MVNDFLETWGGLWWLILVVIAAAGLFRWLWLEKRARGRDMVEAAGGTAAVTEESGGGGSGGRPKQGGLMLQIAAPGDLRRVAPRDWRLTVEGREVGRGATAKEAVQNAVLPIVSIQCNNPEIEAYLDGLAQQVTPAPDERNAEAESASDDGAAGNPGRAGRPAPRHRRPRRANGE